MEVIEMDDELLVLGYGSRGSTGSGGVRAGRCGISRSALDRPPKSARDQLVGHERRGDRHRRCSSSGVAVKVAVSGGAGVGVGMGGVWIGSWTNGVTRGIWSDAVASSRYRDVKSQPVVSIRRSPPRPGPPLVTSPPTGRVPRWVGILRRGIIKPATGDHECLATPIARLQSQGPQVRPVPSGAVSPELFAVLVAVVALRRLALQGGWRHHGRHGSLQPCPGGCD